MKKRTKKLIAAAITLAMLMTCMAFPAAAFGAETTATVTVIASKDPKKPEVYTLEVSSDAFNTVTDSSSSMSLTHTDPEGIVTLADVFTVLHKEKYSAQDFAMNVMDWGYGASPGIQKCFGIESPSCGYKINNESAWSLADEVKDGDVVSIYIYGDNTTWSDIYYFFDEHNYSIDEGDSLTITLNAAAYDESYNPITVPGTDRNIVLTDSDGNTSEADTDDNGKAVFKDLAEGIYIASINSNGDTDYFIMPWAQVTVNAAEEPATEPTTTEEPATEPTTEPATTESQTTEPATTTGTTVPENDDAADTGDNFSIMPWLVLATAAAIGVVALTSRRKTDR